MPSRKHSNRKHSKKRHRRRSSSSSSHRRRRRNSKKTPHAVTDIGAANAQGWHDEAPKKGSERHQLPAKCFLSPEDESYPICRRRSKKISCKALKAAYMRARQQHRPDLATKAQTRAKLYRCDRRRIKKKRRSNKKTKKKKAKKKKSSKKPTRKTSAKKRSQSRHSKHRRR
jgi:hypothetical protein